MKKALEIILNIAFWVLSTYAILIVFVPQSIDVDIINDKEVVKNVYGRDFYNNRYLIINIIGTIIKIIFYYFHVYYISKYFYNKQLKKYIRLLFTAIIIAYLVNLLKTVVFFGSEFIAIESLLVSFLVLLFFAGISFVHIVILRWRKEEKLKQKLKEEKLTAELQLLKSQINPHFLFNALNNLLSISEKHQQIEVSSGISQLSELLRFLLHDTSDNTILLVKEIEFIKNYIELNRLRFDDKDPIKIDFNTSGKYKDVYIIPAILIPFVENAFKHGIDIYNPSFVAINVDVNEKGDINFKCSNSISKAKQHIINSKNSGIGLQNVKQRLKILYPNAHDLIMHKKDNVFFVELKLYLNA